MLQIDCAHSACNGDVVFVLSIHSSEGQSIFRRVVLDFDSVVLIIQIVRTSPGMDGRLIRDVHVKSLHFAVNCDRTHWMNLENVRIVARLKGMFKQAAEESADG